MAKIYVTKIMRGFKILTKLQKIDIILLIGNMIVMLFIILII